MMLWTRQQKAAWDEGFEAHEQRLGMEANPHQHGPVDGASQILAGFWRWGWWVAAMTKSTEIKRKGVEYAVESDWPSYW